MGWSLDAHTREHFAAHVEAATTTDGENSRGVVSDLAQVIASVFALFVEGVEGEL